MNRDMITEFANATYGADAKTLMTADLIDFALHILEEKEKRDRIVALRLACLQEGHTFFWQGADYQTGQMTMENGGITIEGWKSAATKCLRCDALLGLTYQEGVI